MAISDFLGLAPEVGLIIGAFAILLLMAKTRQGKQPALVAFATLIITSVLALGTLVPLPGLDALPQQDVILGLFEVSVFSQLLKLVFLLGAAIVVLASTKYMDRSTMQAEYYALILLAVLGMNVVASSRDLLTLFIGVEIASFASYALAASFKDEPTSTEAAMKYFITGALSSSLVLYGISLLYGSAGTITFDGLQQFWMSEVQRFSAVSNPALHLMIAEPINAIGIFLLLGGLGFKFTVAPFHMWAPDTYTGAPDTVASFLAGVGKGLGFVALAKVFIWALAPLAGGWEPFVAGLAIVTMTWGNLVAIRQDDIKRMLAYSSIAQAGYILIVLPVAASYVDLSSAQILSGAGVDQAAYAIAGGIFHTVTNLLMKGGAFLVVAAFALAGIGSKITDYEGLGHRNPFLALSLTVFLLSLAGLPPLGGFWSKFVVFSSAIDTGLNGSWLWWLAVAGIVNSAISLFYYARWIRAMYTEEATHPVEVHTPTGLSVAIAASLVGIIAIGFFANPVIDWSWDAARALMAQVP